MLTAGCPGDSRELELATRCVQMHGFYQHTSDDVREHAARSGPATGPSEHGSSSWLRRFSVLNVSLQLWRRGDSAERQFGIV